MDTFPTQELELVKDDLTWRNKEICQLSTEGLASHCKEWGGGLILSVLKNMRELYQ